MNQVLTLREAAERLGVHYMTVYRYVRLGLLPSHRRGRTWFITSDDLDVFSSNASERPPAVSRRTAPWHERLTNRLLAGDRTGAWKVVESAMTGGMTPLQVYDEVIVPALREIGQRWETGAIGIDEEHQATVIVNRVIGRMGQNFATRGRQKGTVVLACPPGERHVLGLAMVADALRGGGYASLDLGGDTPVAALESALRRVDEVVAVCIGAFHDAVLADVHQMVLAARRNIARSCPVILGGAAIVDDAHARRLGADAKAELTTVVAAVELGREAQPTVQV